MGSIPDLGRFHVLQSNWACCPQLLSPRGAATEACVPRACALQEKPPHEKSRNRMQSSLHLPQLEKACVQQPRPSSTKKKKKKILKCIYLRYRICWFDICKHCEIFPTIRLTDISIASHSCHFLFVSAWRSWYVSLNHLICAKPCVCAGNKKWRGQKRGQLKEEPPGFFPVSHKVYRLLRKTIKQIIRQTVFYTSINTTSKGCWGSLNMDWKRISRHRALQKGVNLLRTESRCNLGTASTLGLTDQGEWILFVD